MKDHISNVWDNTPKATNAERVLELLPKKIYEQKPRRELIENDDIIETIEHPTISDDPKNEIINLYNQTTENDEEKRINRFRAGYE